MRLVVHALADHALGRQHSQAGHLAAEVGHRGRPLGLRLAPGRLDDSAGVLGGLIARIVLDPRGHLLSAREHLLDLTPRLGEQVLALAIRTLGLGPSTVGSFETLANPLAPLVEQPYHRLIEEPRDQKDQDDEVGCMPEEVVPVETEKLDYLHRARPVVESAAARRGLRWDVAERARRPLRLTDRSG